jgi:hypothetical protein
MLRRFGSIGQLSVVAYRQEVKLTISAVALPARQRHDLLQAVREGASPDVRGTTISQVLLSRILGASAATMCQPTTALCGDPR